MSEQSRQRSRERLEQREREILDAATRLFATHGFHATSTRRIAAAAGVSEGTVFHYFGSKNELMLAILDRFYNGLLNPGAAAILDTLMGTRERLRALAVHHVTALAADNALMMRLLQVYVGVDLELIGKDRESPLRALNRSYVGYLDRALREGRERGELHGDLSLRACRDLFFGTLEYGMRTHMVREGSERDIESSIDVLLAPIWRGLSPAARAGDGHGDAAARINAACDRLESLLGAAPGDARPPRRA
jgi:TetR/AcrR family fatty acid metabolism transcriptional regulator